MKRLRGLWILLIGFPVLIASDSAYIWRAQSENAHLRQSGWQLFIEPSEVEKGALWGAAFAIAFGFGLLMRDLARRTWRQTR